WSSGPWRWRRWCRRMRLLGWRRPGRLRRRSIWIWPIPRSRRPTYWRRGGTGARREGSVWNVADPGGRAPAVLAARAAAAEDAAFSVQGVTNSEGGEAGYGRHEVVLVTSAGFARRPLRTS